MGWTKGDIVDAAYAELAIQGWVYDLTPEERQWALGRLNLLMATGTGNGLVLPYNQGASANDDDLSAESGLPLFAVEYATLALAVRISAGKGKAVPGSTKAALKAATDAVSSQVAHAQLQEQQNNGQTPAGAGNKPWRTTRRPFLNPTDTSPIQNSIDGGLAFEGSN